MELASNSNKKRKEMDRGDAGKSGSSGHVFASVESATVYILELEAKLKQAEERAEKAETMLAKSKTVNDKEEDVESDDDDNDDPTENSNDPWMNMYRQMREYRIINGHCKVPMKYSRNPKLGWWVANQRKSRKGSGNAKKMSAERVALLDAIGFVWGKDSPEPVAWEARYQELAKFRQNVGHCNIPLNSTDPSALACWVAAQRAEYKRFKRGRDSLLTLDQIGKLNEIGFSWKNPKKK